VHSKNILEVKDLHVSFDTRRGEVRAVNGLSFELEAGKTLGIVGESGSGKSVSMNAVMGLVRDSNVKISGEVFFKGEDLLKRSDDEMRKVRGKEIAMVFQDPMTALTPVYTVGWHIVEQIKLHTQLSKKEARDRAIEILDEVGIPDAKRRVDQYPHEFSGGMRQRAAMARTLAVDPLVLLLDEPFSALDAQTKMILQQDLAQTVKAHGKTVVFITHDLAEGVALSDRILVMSERPGTIIEEIVVDIPDRENPLQRRKHHSVGDYVARLMDLLKLDAHADVH